MFGDLDWPLNASRGLSAIAEFLALDRQSDDRQSGHPKRQSANKYLANGTIRSPCRRRLEYHITVPYTALASDVKIITWANIWFIPVQSSPIYSMKPVAYLGGGACARVPLGRTAVIFITILELFLAPFRDKIAAISDQMRFLTKKCSKMRLRPGLRPGPHWGSLQRSPSAANLFTVDSRRVVPAR